MFNRTMKFTLPALLLMLCFASTVEASFLKNCVEAGKNMLHFRRVARQSGGPDAVDNPKSYKKWKYLNFGMAMIGAQLSEGNTPFVRFIPTDQCNLRCSYCFQHSADNFRMSREEFAAYLAKAKQNHVGMITFLGGEPMVWRQLYYAIASATRNHVITDMTTNGALLNERNIERLGRAGLDLLNISVDGVRKSDVSQKTSIIERPELVHYLKEARKKYGMQFRMNSVIHKGNFEEIKEIIEFAHEHDIPLSLGFVVPHSSGEEVANPGTYFSIADAQLLDEIIGHIVEKKRDGYDIIDPEEYFEGIYKYLNRENFWECNYPTKFGWVNVTPRGGIRSCTKKMGEMAGFAFLSLDALKMRELKSQLRVMVSECNKNCYSNCAFDSYFYRTHKFKALKRLLGIP